MNQMDDQKMPVFEDSPAEIETASQTRDVEIKTAKEELVLDYSYSSFLFEILQNITYQELTDEEILTLAEKAGTFELLDAPEEDIYDPADGTPI